MTLSQDASKLSNETESSINIGINNCLIGFDLSEENDFGQTTWIKHNPSTKVIQAIDSVVSKGIPPYQTKQANACSRQRCHPLFTELPLLKFFSLF